MKLHPPINLPGQNVRVQRQNSSYAWFVCFVMCISFTVSYMDRAIVPLLVQPLEHAFGLTDTAISLLQGAAFAVFYTFFAFPLARVADNGNRRNLILAGVTVWCAATIGCGLARTIPELFLCRIFVAIGEAVLQPAAVSILSDYFSPQHRTRALSVYAMGVFFGGGLAMAGGGTLLRGIGAHGAVLGPLGHFDSWRLVFIFLGLAGLILLPLLLGVKEPVRLSDAGHRSETLTTLSALFVEFKRRRAALSATVFGFATIAMAATTVQVWAPTFFVREYGWSLGQTGQRLGIIALVLCPLGALIGALISERLVKAGRSDGKLITGLISASVCALTSFVTVTSSAGIAIAAIAVTLFMIGFNFGLVQAALAELLPNRMRSVGAACYIGASNLLAATLGPLLVGVINDHVFHNPMMLATSLRIVVPAAFGIAAGILYLGLRPYRNTLSQSSEKSGPEPQLVLSERS